MKRKILFFMCSLVFMCIFGSISANAMTRDEALSWAKYHADNRTAFDVDETYGVQCSDFATAYINYILTDNAYSGTYTTYYGYNYFNLSYPDGWQRIENTSDFVPEPGDILCFGPGIKNSSGHVAVAIEGCTVSEMKAIDQDGISQAPTRYSTLHYFTDYWNFQGVIRPKWDDNLGSPVDLGTDFYAYIINTKMWKHLTYDSDSNVTIRAETGDANQIWHFERLNDGSYKISSAKDGLCLDVDNYGATSGTNVKVCTSNNTTAQRWYIYGTSGAYKLRAQCTNCVLDVNGNNSADGTNIQMWESNSTDAQIWSIYSDDNINIKPANLAVSVGTSMSDTKFTWNSVSKKTRYDVKIWKNKIWEGDPYHIEWNTNSGYSIKLPEGTYQAYVDTYNSYDCKMSNVLTFTVNSGGIDNRTWIYADKTKYKIGETIKFRFGYRFGTSVSLGIDRNGARYATPEVTGKASYDMVLTEPGNYEVYSSGWSQSGYEDSEKIYFTVYTEDTYPYEYFLSFDANGGTLDNENKKVIRNAPYGELPTPTRSGYAFIGWYTGPIGGTQVTRETIVTAKSDHTLYAQWKKLEPYTRSTVTGYDNTYDAHTDEKFVYVVDTELYDSTDDCTIIVAGYNNGKMETFTTQSSTQENRNFRLTSDVAVDEIKVMLWNDTSLIKPLCKIESITNWLMHGLIIAPPLY